MKFVKSVMPILRNYRRMPTTGFPQCVCLSVCVWVTETFAIFSPLADSQPTVIGYQPSTEKRECESDFEWKMNGNEKWMLMGKGGRVMALRWKRSAEEGRGLWEEIWSHFGDGVGVEGVRSGGGLDNRGVTDSFLANLIAEVKKNSV